MWDALVQPFAMVWEWTYSHGPVGVFSLLLPAILDAVFFFVILNVTAPFTVRSLRNTEMMDAVKVHTERVRELFPDDEVQTQKLMQLWQHYRVSPLGGCFWISGPAVIGMVSPLLLPASLYAIVFTNPDDTVLSAPLSMLCSQAPASACSSVLDLDGLSLLAPAYSQLGSHQLLAAIGAYTLFAVFSKLLRRFNSRSQEGDQNTGAASTFILAFGPLVSLLVLLAFPAIMLVYFSLRRPFLIVVQVLGAWQHNRRRVQARADAARKMEEIGPMPDSFWSGGIRPS